MEQNLLPHFFKFHTASKLSSLKRVSIRWLLSSTFLCYSLDSAFAMMSLITSPARISPAAEGTNEMLPGT